VKRKIGQKLMYIGNTWYSKGTVVEVAEFDSATHMPLRVFDPTVHTLDDEYEHMWVELHEVVLLAEGEGL